MQRLPEDITAAHDVQTKGGTHVHHLLWGILLLPGLQFWIDVYDAVLVLIGLDRGNEWIAIPVHAASVALAVVCFRRGRRLAGLFGLFVPLALAGAVTPARPQARSTA